jgi:hypothetical protein
MRFVQKHQVAETGSEVGIFSIIECGDVNMQLSHESGSIAGAVEFQKRNRAEVYWSIMVGTK